MGTWTHKYVANRVTPSAAGRIKATRTTVTAGLHKLEGNDRPYFSVTCSVDEQARNNRWIDVGGGADHETIVAYWPKLAPVIALHLADDNGVPMHAAANAVYHAGFSKGMADARNVNHLANHLRISPDDAQTLIDRCGRAFNAAFARGQEHPHEIPAAMIADYVDEQRSRWADEARAAIELLDELAATK
jgi:hypothetical protein